MALAFNLTWSAHSAPALAPEVVNFVAYGRKQGRRSQCSYHHQMARFRQQCVAVGAATFVGLQSIPGLAVLYGGIVKKKWAINSAFMCFYAFASVLVVWILFDYNMAFGHSCFHSSAPDAGDLGGIHLGPGTIPAAASGMPDLTFPMATLISSSSCSPRSR